MPVGHAIFMHIIPGWLALISMEVSALFSLLPLHFVTTHFLAGVFAEGRSIKEEEQESYRGCDWWCDRQPPRGRSWGDFHGEKKATTRSWGDFHGEKTAKRGHDVN